MNQDEKHVVRDQEWLENLLADIWYQYFSDVEQTNMVKIRFGRKAIRRLGSISLDRKDQKTTIITLTGLYKNQYVPEYVIVATIVHEMSHYAHGFNSPLNQKHRHPHSGGVIRKEFAERGLEKLYLQQQKWLKSHWPIVVDKFLNQKGVKRSKFYTKNNYKVVYKPWWIRE